MTDLTETANPESESLNFGPPEPANAPKQDGPPNRAQSVRLLAVAAFVLAVAVVLMHKPWSQPEGGDEAIWDYVAQCIVRGQTPYRDVVEIKSPLSAYLSAAAMLLGRSAGVRDVIAVRILNVLMLGTLSSLILLIAVTFLDSRLAACIAVLVPLVPSHFAEWMVTGTEPKLPMILFGLFSLLFIARGKAFWSGFFSTLACLCWQPGLMFTAVALLMFSRYLTNWRDLEAIKVLLGAVVPLAAMIVYFYSLGALTDLWTWTVVYPVRVYAPETAKGLGATIGLLWRVSVRVFRFDLVLVALSGAGLVMFGIERVKARLKDGTLFESPCLREDAIVLLPVIYLTFCLINFQSGPDLIPLFPFVGLFAGWLIVRLGEARSVRRLAPNVPTVALVALLGLIIFRSMTYKLEAGLTLQDQQKEFAAILSALAPDDRVYVHGSLEILVLLNRPNMNPYIFLDRGKDDWIAKQTPGGFPAILNKMESSSPKVVAISRLGKVAHRAELRNWVEGHYDQMDLPGYEGVYLRRQPR